MQAERKRTVLVQCSDAIHGASALPVDVGHRLCTQTLGSINTLLMEVLSQRGYDYLIPTRPTASDDDTLHTPSTRGSGHRGSSSRSSSRGSSRGFGYSSSQCRPLRSPSSSTNAISPFVSPGPVSTQRREPALDDITEANESTPTSTTDVRSKRGRRV